MKVKSITDNPDGSYNLVLEDDSQVLGARIQGVIEYTKTEGVTIQEIPFKVVEAPDSEQPLPPPWLLPPTQRRLLGGSVPLGEVVNPNITIKVFPRFVHVRSKEVQEAYENEPPRFISQHHWLVVSPNTYRVLTDLSYRHISVDTDRPLYLCFDDEPEPGYLDSLRDLLGADLVDQMLQAQHGRQPT